MLSFGEEIEPSFACRRSLQMAWNLPFVCKITGHFSTKVLTFLARGLSRRCRCGGAWRCKWELPKPG
jgi:hypothetical protein